jgi:hypothetical protein
MNPVSNPAAVQFTVDLFQASPPPPPRRRGSLRVNPQTIAPVAFLLKIELLSSQTFSFQWAVSLVAS